MYPKPLICPINGLLSILISVGSSGLCAFAGISTRCNNQGPLYTPKTWLSEQEKNGSFPQLEESKVSDLRTDKDRMLGRSPCPCYHLP